MADGEPPKLTFIQRRALRKLRRMAGRGDGEPLQPADWEASWRMHALGRVRAVGAVIGALPASPRCAICAAPFAGWGSKIAGPLGYRPSRKNPTVCATCVELSPPGGMKMPTGVLFADLRGFTARSEAEDPQVTAELLRRFYRCAEDVLFPEAVIDKLIGDEVMALYLPTMKRMSPDGVPSLMLEHALGLLRAVGYGTPHGPLAELGIGLDWGEAFVGNIGQRALYDFTAVGDVVNTAARLQGQAAGGEVVVSERAGATLGSVPRERVVLALKGKSEAQVAYRVRI